MDATNQGTPGAGGQLSGEAARQAAIKRMQKLYAQGQPQAPKAPSVPKG